MKRASKSNRVSWAPRPNLRQVKFFYSDDHPSKVGKLSEDHHQAKRSILTSTTDEYDDDLPPGFGGNRFQNQSKLELSPIPQIKWKCPPMVGVSNHWRVAAGEESKEKDYEKLREKRMFEAMYPRRSAIPPSPYVSREVEEESYDDNLTPHIPIVVNEEDDDDCATSDHILIEEREEVTVDPEPVVADAEHGNTLTKLQPQKLQPPTSPINSQCNISATVPLCACGKPVLESTSLVADLLAASAVVAAFMKSNDELLKIFNDPIMMEKLIKEYKAATAAINASSSAVSIPNSDSQGAVLSVPISQPEGVVSETNTPINTVDSLQVTPSVSLLSKPLCSQSAETGSLTMPTPLPPPISTPYMHTPVNQNIPYMPNGVRHSLNSQSPQRNTLDKPATPPVPFSKPLSGQLAATSSVTIPTPPPPPISTPHKYRPVNKNIPLVPDGVLHSSNSYSPQRTQAVSSGAERTAPSASVPSSELNSVAVPSANSENMHAGAKRVLSTASAVPHQPGAGLTSSIVKDVNYYKSLIWLHGSDNNNVTKLGESKFIVKKQCRFFKSSKGCRRGSKCPYQHDGCETSNNVPVAQNAKRAKVEE